MNPTQLIIRREYMSRVRRRSFIISTLLMPIVMIALMALPSLVAVISGPEEKVIAVVDNSNSVEAAFVSGAGMSFELSTYDQLDELKKRENLDAIIVIPENVVDNPRDVVMYTNGSPSPQTEMYIAQLLNTAIEHIRMSRYEIDNLDQIIADIKADVSMKTIRIDGSEEQAASSIASYLVGMIMAFILYMFIMLYGQMVMNSIIEEKNNRVLR